MSCDAGLCTATAQKAVLNVTDLQNMLTGGDVAVRTGSVAKDIDIDQALTWSGTSRLTLDAQRSVIVNKQVTASGTGALTVITNDGRDRNKDGEFVIVLQRGSVQFWDLASKLIIDGQRYTLVGDVKTLASEIGADPSGFYALAKPYDASTDGTYFRSPVSGFGGTFEGLGNTIDGLHVRQKHLGTGLFAYINAGGKVRDLGLTRVDIAGTSPNGHYQDVTGALAGENGGIIHNCYATGVVRARVGDVGGLVGWNANSIDSSWAKVSVKGGYDAGGLAGINLGIIAESYAAGNVSRSEESGGLVGWNQGALGDSYSTGLVSSSGLIGGVIGYDQSHAGSLATDYWDLDTSGVADPAQGAGNIPNEPGLVGLSDAQLKSGLPDGFSSKIWGQSSHINNGYPYLLANPPR